MSDAIICDIDGTLAHMVDRSPYDPSLYHTDTVDECIREIVSRYRTSGIKILICSGRDDTYQGVTQDWLHKNGVLYDKLFMRPAGDKTDDALVKKALYDTRIKDKYNVLFVLDDRNRVVDMWRSLGLKCLQVAPGDF